MMGTPKKQEPETVTDKEVEDLLNAATTEGMEQFEAKHPERKKRVDKMKFEEASEEAARLRAQEHQDSAVMVEAIRAKMGLTEAVPLEKAKKQKLAVSAEEMQALQNYGDFMEKKRRTGTRPPASGAPANP